MFSLEQAAQRIERLAGQARAPALLERLRTLARHLAEQAETLTREHGGGPSHP